MSARRFLVVLVVAASLPAGAAGRRTTLHVAGTSCEGCEDQLRSALEAVEGVVSVAPRLERGAIEIDHDDRVRPETLVDAAVRAGFRAGLAPDRLRGPNLLEGFDPATDVKVIASAGEDVDLATTPVVGKVTVVEFFATWCLPCRDLDRRLARLLAADPGLAVRRINVVDWSTPVARRHLREVDALPHLRIYDGEGNLVAELTGPSVRRLEEAIRRAAGRP